MSNLPKYPKGTLFIGEFISSESATLIIKGKSFFLDFCDNAYIAGDHFFVNSRATNKATKRHNYNANLFKVTASASSSVLRFLLMNETPYSMRKIAALCQCSLGEVAKVKSFLEVHDYLNREESTSAISDKLGLIKEWKETYQRGLEAFEKKKYLSFLPLEEIRARLSSIYKEKNPNFHLSGDWAAQEMLGKPLFGKGLIYASPMALLDLEKTLELIPSEKGVMLEIMEAPSDSAIMHPQEENNLPCVGYIEAALTSDYTEELMRKYLDI
ncbi:MAG: hypothetical protein HUJ60_04980 [Bacilli bacterium]|nr:hypothetical protein [Bacilli bacterium]